MNKLKLNILTFSVLAAICGASTVEAAPRRKPAKPVRRAAAPGKAPQRAGTSDVATGSREKVSLPTSQALKTPVAARSLGAVKPPRSNDFYESNNKEAEYESLVDQEIKALYNLSQANKRSPNRGEIWLRLGERYVEKARLVEFREQANYDKELKAFMEKKSRVRPRIDNRLSREYNRKAIELYQWFVQDFPKDPKVDQALFFLGYNQFELGNVDQGERYYLQLLQQYPESPYVIESRFALGEYYFENEQWQKALDNYAKVIEAKRARLNAFALYKASWCYYRLGRAAAGLKSLERVVRLSRASDSNENISGGSKRAVNKVRLASEALKDYVPFYSEVGDPRRAYSEFNRVSGDEKQAMQMLERLAYIYADAGARANANSIFKQLISMNPTGERAAEYQYQVVLAYATSEPRAFRSELEIWLNMFGPESDWAKTNAKNQKLVSDMANLQETTVRNNVLQLHQTAQNSRIETAQKAAAAAYAQYFRYFPNSQKQIEMRFFYAELLYDMDRFADAAKLYNYVADHDEPNGKYRERAIVNTLLALEKDLPSSQDIESRRGKSIDPIPLDPPVARFEAAALKYANAFPKSEKSSDILRRLGVLYYNYNQFDKAIDVFQRILRDYPKSPNAEIAGNLILDIYKLKGDMIGLADKGQEMLQNPSIANTAFGTKIRGMMEKASFMKADKLAEKGDPAAAAKQYEQFATQYKASDLAVASRYKAAASYEKAGDLVSAMRMHTLIIASGDSSDPKIRAVQNDSRNALSHLYQQTGQLELAAKSYHDYASANVKDTKAVNGFFNAGVLYDALGDYNQAQANYDAYFARSKNADRIEVLYLDAQIWKKRGNQGRAASYFDRYIKEGGRNQAHVVEAVYEMARNSKRLGQVSKQKDLWQEVISRYKRAGAAKEATAAYAAEAQFELSQSVLRDLNSIKFYRNAKQQAQAANDIKQFREKYINEMKKVILFDNAKWIIAALTSSGQMFESVARKFDGIQTPSGFSEEDAKKYRELITQQSNGFREEAKTSYKAAVDRSQELESYSEWTTTARQALAGLDPASKAKDAGEVASEAAALDWMGL